MSKDLFSTDADAPPEPTHWTAWVRTPPGKWCCLGSRRTEAEARALALDSRAPEQLVRQGDARP